VGVNDGAPVLLKNNVGSQSNWLGIKLAGKSRILMQSASESPINPDILSAAA
jgi:hypothetical protein